MDTLKSYFTKMKILPGHSNRGWKFTRKGSCGKSHPKKKYMRSKSQNDASFEPQMDVTDLPDNKENGLSKTGTLLARDSTRESTKHAPAKPPRKDQLFSVCFRTSAVDNLGLTIGTNQTTCFDDSISSNLSQGVDMNDSTDEMAYRTISPIKVVSIDQAGQAHAENSIQLHDEVIEINGQSVQGESVVTARKILDEAVQSGCVVMKLRRKRKKHAPSPPSLPGSTSQTPYTSLSSSNLHDSTGNGHSLTGQGHFTQSASCLDSDRYNSHHTSFTLNSLNSSESSLTASNDDVFTNSVTEVNLVPKPYFNGGHNHLASPRQRRRIGLDPGRVEEQRTQSASAVEDIQWEPLPRQNSDYVNTVELAKSCNYGVLSQISNNGCDMDLNLYQSDTELQMCTRMYRQRRAARSNDMYRQMNNSTPTSLCSFDEGSEYDFSCQSSPAVGKKRVITRLHLLKENDSLGLHIAGGKGSKRGDIGIFVAGITESGPAQRDGRLKRGDELLMINGRSLIGVTHAEAVDLLRNAPKLVQLVIAAKVRKSSSMASTVSNFSTSQGPLSPDMGGAGTIPEVMAQTPQGTVVTWEDMFDKFHGNDEKPPSGASSANGRYSKRRNRSPSPRHLPPITITLHKGLGGKGLGFTIVGGSDTPIGNMGIIVRRVFKQGLVAEDGRIKQGDEILELNGECISHLTHKEVIGRFRKLKRGPVSITFRKRLRSPQCSPARAPYLSPTTSCDGSPVSTPGHSPASSMSDLRDLEVRDLDLRDLDYSDSMNSSSSHASSDHRPTFSVPVNIPRNSAQSNGTPIVERLSPDNKPNIQHNIQLVKDGSIGLGISVIRKTYDGVSEILIQDISHGSPAYKDGRLRKGDMIAEVNGRCMTNMTLLDAYQLFRSLQPGTVDIVIRRKDDLQVIQLILTDTQDIKRDNCISRTDSNGSDLPCSTGASWEGTDLVPAMEGKIPKKEPVRKRLSTVSEEASTYC